MAKIVPKSPESLIHWRAVWVYNFENKQIEIKFSIKVQSFHGTDSDSLEEILPLFFADEKSLAVGDAMSKKLLAEGVHPYYLSCCPVVPLQENAALLRFSVSANLQNGVSAK